VEKKWVFGWEKKSFSKKKNPDLWIRFLKTYRRQRVSFIWVKGHANNKENERCDFLAVEAADGQNLLTDHWYEKNTVNKDNSLF
jgi:ribonuclease HI